MQPEPAEIPLHERTIRFRAFDRGDRLLVVATLVDERPWATGGAVGVLHDMELAVEIGVEDLVIRHGEGAMHRHPHVECTDILPDLTGLVGLSVARGYTRRVQGVFGGVRGCTHLDQLARALGPVVIQAVTSARARRVAGGEIADLLSGGSSPWAIGSCHVWAAEGPAVAKLEAGWRPGLGEYPAPTAVTLRARSAGGSGVSPATSPGA